MVRHSLNLSSSSSTKIKLLIALLLPASLSFAGGGFPGFGGGYGFGSNGMGLQSSPISQMTFQSENARKEYYVQFIVNNVTYATGSQLETFRQSIVNDLNSTNYTSKEKAEILKAASENLAGSANLANQGSKLYDKLPSLAMVQSSENYNAELLKQLESTRSKPADGLLSKYDQLTSLGRRALFQEEMLFFGYRESDAQARIKQVQEKLQNGSVVEKDFSTNILVMKSLNQKSEKALSKNLMDKFAEAVQRDSGYLCGLNSPVLWKNAGFGFVGADNDKIQAYQARREQQMARYAEKVVPVLKQLKAKNISLDQECLKSPSNMFQSLSELGFAKEVAELQGASSPRNQLSSKEDSFNQLLSGLANKGCDVPDLQAQIMKMSKTAASSKVTQLVVIQQQKGCGITGMITSEKMDLAVKVNGVEVVHFKGKNQEAELSKLANQMKALPTQAKTEANIVLPGLNSPQANGPLTRLSLPSGAQQRPSLQKTFGEVFGAK
jgi:hypothetical protein